MRLVRVSQDGIKLMKKKLASLSIALLFSSGLFNQTIHADESNKNNFLPPLIPWQGKSELIIVDDSNPWQTPAEKTGLMDTPNYQETMSYLTRLVDSDKRLSKVSLGKSPQGRDIWMIIANNEGRNTPLTLQQTNKPTLLIQAGIHSGEIDGKDAGLMLLRDIVHGNKSNLIDKVNLLFVPILSADAHERRSPYNRVNQRGPTQMGWRSNAQNLNLNRDYSKLDTPELQHLIKAINLWQPDLYYDVHVTDGEDYQYDITYGFTGEHGDSPNISRWLSQILQPSVNKALSANGHLGGPLTFGVDSIDFKKGISGWTAPPRFSNGYGDVRHLPTVLIETHSLKPYKQRVLGTYVMLEQTLKLLANKGIDLQKAILKDQSIRNKQQVVAWQVDQKNPEKMDYAGIDYKIAQDPITGLDYVQWLGQPKTYQDLPIYWSRLPQTTVTIPQYYWIPAQYLEVIQRLENHGIYFERVEQAHQIKATQLIANEVKFGEMPFEGRQMPTTSFNEQQITLVMPVGTVAVKTDQVLGNLAVALLDPRAPDSFFSWGFFNQMFQRTEYIESYAMIPLIQQMLAKDPTLKTAFELKKKADEKFASDPRAQMSWFYERSEFYDNAYLKYPVLLEY